VTTAQNHIADTFNRAQLCWDSMLDPDYPDDDRRTVINLFIYHVTVAVLLEHVRRLKPDLADQLTGWLFGEPTIFEDGYAGELLHQWRQQVAAGEPMDPIGPQS
jgi:hypothetical protein